jgi:hypothetical protein
MRKYLRRAVFVQRTAAELDGQATVIAGYVDVTIFCELTLWRWPWTGGDELLMVGAHMVQDPRDHGERSAKSCQPIDP